ncbi:hypothetical protein HMPREF3213_02143 [Heyndrickxia coagulans]|uniref:Uncharacterized protein n=1 Tax=Heyndrickxia coagulans TaxID=1398 RepID=A0A133KNJ9_HEYCO|nr:hypothetical protein HMPREF3213_02143 [Heyndrickxia coagulans]
MKAWCINQSHSLLKAGPCAGFSWKATTFYRLPRHALGAAVSTPNLPQQKAADVFEFLQEGAVLEIRE